MGFFPSKIKLYLISAILIIHLPFSAFGAAITDIRFWSAPDHTRVVLDSTAPIQYQSSPQEDPAQYRIELTGITSFPKKREFEVKDKYLLKISLNNLGKGKVQLVLHQKTALQANIFALKPDLGKTHRLVIDLIDVGQEKKEQEEREKQKEIRQKGTKIVVIDPGHGGEDPGAVGSRKTLEKDVVLKVGEKVVHLVNQQKEMKAFLTRKGDYFIPLEERVRMAREYGADLFISLHSDGSFNPQIRGSSVYCLSLTGASDQAAKLLADKENMSNILGGAFLRPASLSKDPNLNQILLDLMQNNSMKESFRFAELVLNETKETHPLKFSTYRQANFIVLRAPDIPSVLVELAFITNKEDEHLLSQSGFQEKIAKNLVNAILKYFRQ
ncbi:MAG: AMIN domain-containing protein [Deltaproteobacteria bacterium]|nr:AMIN domain-containing protein [Deltaproteobacteria bacterium]MBM4348050.1 AMIN domain-containing protein [Deltaproteobacteria bacterium]